jgi:hypothetical protein
VVSWFQILLSNGSNVYRYVEEIVSVTVTYLYAYPTVGLCFGRVDHTGDCALVAWTIPAV